MIETAVRKTFLPTLQSEQSNMFDPLQGELRAYLEQNQLGWSVCDKDVKEAYPV